MKSLFYDLENFEIISSTGAICPTGSDTLVKSIIIRLKRLTGLAFFVVVLTDHQLVYRAKNPKVIAICYPKMRTKTCLQFEMQLPKANWQIIG